MIGFLFACFIMGDSIATGLSAVTLECKHAVKSGITSEQWYDKFKYNPYYRDTLYKTVVISLGTNDYKNNTEEKLHEIRRWVRGERIFWVLPSPTKKPLQRSIVEKVARHYNDSTVDISKMTGKDGIHPPSLSVYKEISDKIPIIKH